MNGFGFKILSVLIAASIASSVRAAESSAQIDSTAPVPAPDQSAGTGAGAPEQLGEIEVLGSHVPRPDVETSDPVVVIGRAEIERLGYTQVGDIIQQLTFMGSSLNRRVNNGSDGTVQVNLRYLGPQRTLVLVNGQRWSANAFGVSDVGTIPVSVVDHIEVLLDGASAVYGADAIVGVINIITRDRFEGNDAGIHYGEFSQGDGAQRSYDFTTGINGARGSLLLNVSYAKDSALFASRRAISACPVPGAPCNDLLSADFPVLNDVGASRAISAGFFNLGDYYTPGDFGNRYTLIAGRSGSSPNDFRLFDPHTDGYNFQPFNYLQTPSQRTGAFLQGRYALSEHVDFQGEFLFDRRESNQLIAPLPLPLYPGGVGSGASGSTGVGDGISAQNVYNPFGIDIPVAFRRLVEAPGRRTSQAVNTWYGSAALSGLLSAWQRELHWNVGASFARTDQDETDIGQADLRRVALAVGPSFRDSAGEAHCGTADAVIADCVPLNVFGGPGSITPAMLDYILYTGIGTQGSRRSDVEANVGTDLVQLPAGPLGVSLGYEFRRDSSFVNPDPVQLAGFTLDTPSLNGPLSGNSSANEVYLEFNLPVLKEHPFVQALDLSLAERASRYDNFGSTTNGKFNLRWKPGDDLLVRASYAQGFHAPSVGQLFQGQGDTAIIGGFYDPCAASNAPTPVAAANCAADRVPPGFNPPDTAISHFITGANSKLQPETSTTKALGLVYSPSAIPGFDLYLDWYDLVLHHTIGDLGQDPNLTPTFIIDSCYQTPRTTATPFSGPYCNHLQRDSTGLITQVLSVLENQGDYRQQGYELHLQYHHETPYGRFALASESSYLAHYTQASVPAADANGNLQFSTISVPGFYLGQQAAYWRLRTNLSLDWQHNAWGATAVTRYYPALEEGCPESFIGTAAERLCKHLNYYNTLFQSELVNRLGSRWYLDLQARWDAPWLARMSLGLQNATNRDPPIAYSSGNRVDPAYPTPGRFWYLEYRQRF